MRIVRGPAALTLFFCQFASAAGVVSIYPSPTDTTPGATKQYVIYNTTGGTGVTWSVNGITGGNSSVGTVTQAGLYTAPMSVPAQNVVTVTATSTPSGISGSSAVTIHQPVPTVWSTSPSSATTGMQTISLNGANFEAISTVTVGGMPWIPMYMSPTSMKIQGSFMAAGTYAV